MGRETDSKVGGVFLLSTNIAQPTEYSSTSQRKIDVDKDSEI